MWCALGRAEAAHVAHRAACGKSDKVHPHMLDEVRRAVRNPMERFAPGGAHYDERARPRARLEDAHSARVAVKANRTAAKRDGGTERHAVGECRRLHHRPRAVTPAAAQRGRAQRSCNAMQEGARHNNVAKTRYARDAAICNYRSNLQSARLRNLAVSGVTLLFTNSSELVLE